MQGPDKHRNHAMGGLKTLSLFHKEIANVITILPEYLGTTLKDTNLKKKKSRQKCAINFETEKI